MAFDWRHGPPGRFSETDLKNFADMVLGAGEAASEAMLIANLETAHALVMVFDGDKLCGTAALKDPMASYRAQVASNAGVEIPAVAYPFELAYVFLSPAVRGQHLSPKLVEIALEDAEGQGVFATALIENAPMKRLFEKNGFTPEGLAYSGANVRGIQLFVRPAAG